MSRADYLLGCDVIGGAVLLDAGAPPDAGECAPVGDSPPFVLPSAIPGAADEAWTRFAIEARRERLKDGALVDRDPRAVSNGNGFGMFAIPIRRLADRGLVGEPTQTRDPETGRMVWVADFVPPLTARRFLADPGLQYRTFSESMRDYADAIENRETHASLDGMSISGKLAVLHRCGPSGLATWARGQRFERTVEFYERTNGIF